jgi:hypothetical protein
MLPVLRPVRWEARNRRASAHVTAYKFGAQVRIRYFGPPRLRYDNALVERICSVGT